MPSIAEITNYLNKNIILSKDISIYESEIGEDIDYDIGNIMSVEKEYVISDVATLLGLIKNYYSTMYLTLLKKEKNCDNNYLCAYFSSSVLQMVCDHYDYLAERNIFNENLARQGEALLMSFSCNHFEMIEHCYPKIIESILNGKMSRSLPWGGDGNGNVIPPKPQRLGVLAVEMIASEHKQTIDWESANIPTDPFYKRFCQEVLYSKDEHELTYWLTKLCDNHLQWTSLFLDNAERSSSTGYEVEQDALLLWPFEYQAVKNFRARHGLSTPEIEHPLLKTFMAIDHRPNFAVWQKPQWFEPLVSRIIEVNPELGFVREWFKG